MSISDTENCKRNFMRYNEVVVYFCGWIFFEMRYSIICLITLLSGIKNSTAQTNILQGTVTDSISNQPLSWVTVIVNNQADKGVFTDEDGNFMVYDSIQIESLSFSYVGYHSKTISVLGQHKIMVRLTPDITNLIDVTVLSGENPANRIIKEAVNHRSENDYATLNSYSYQAYEKFVVTAMPPDTTSNKKVKPLFDFMQDHDLMISESVIKKIHLSPDLTKETVIAQKVSGMTDPNFTVLISEFQSTNFYKPIINIAQEDYINPVSAGSWNLYFFNIEDTLYESNDTVFVISFVPAKGKIFQSLCGTLEINSNGYALQYIKASHADTTAATLSSTIEQQYEKQGNVWFPVSLKLNIGFKHFLYNNMQVMMSGVTSIDSIQINPSITNKDFDGVSIDLLPDAAKHDSVFWNLHRADSLTQREIQSYKIIDSLGKESHLDALIKFTGDLQDENLRLPVVSIELYRLIKYDKPEEIRLGFGLETNNSLSKVFQIGGWAGYGLRDSLWKHGGFVELHLVPKKNMSLKFTTEQNYEEQGGYHFFQEGYFGSAIDARNYTIRNFNYVNRNQIDFTCRIKKYLNVDASLFQVTKTVLDQYEFSYATDKPPTNNFSFSGVQTSFRFSYKERIVESLGHYYWVNQGYPAIWFQYSQSIKELFGSNFNYTKLSARVQYFFQTKRFGVTNIAAECGWINQSVPATELFTGRSSFSFFGLYAPFSFQTMRSNEFYNSEFASVFFAQDLQRSIFQIGKFQPNVLLITNACWGKLQNPGNHFHLNASSLDKIYLESGVLINNLLAKKMGGIVRVGVGAGVFYRYGYYHLPIEQNNFSFKLSWSYNFN